MSSGSTSASAPPLTPSARPAFLLLVWLTRERTAKRARRADGVTVRRSQLKSFIYHHKTRRLIKTGRVSRAKTLMRT